MTTPETTTTDGADTTKNSSNLTGWGTRRRRLTDSEVEAIRVAYKYRRDLAKTSTRADEWETITETIKDVARDHNVSVDVANRAVLGLSYPHAPGPIDTARRMRHDAASSLRERVGGRIDGRSLSYSTTEIMDTYAACVTITVYDPDKDKTRTFRYPAGTRVTVSTSVSGDDQTSQPGADKPTGK